MNVQQSPYLLNQRQFPYSDLRELANQADISYIDIAQKVNSRVIGIYPTNFFAVTGERWYFSGSSTGQQTLRQVYTFTAAGNITNGLNFAQVSNVTRIYGTLYDGTNYYPLPYVDVSLATNQINVYLTPTYIVITAGGGSPPTIVSGIVVLEYLSQF